VDAEVRCNMFMLCIVI